MRNDHLTVNKTNKNDNHSIEDNWITGLSERNISVLILNTGAHYKEDDLLLPQLDFTFSFLLEQLPNLNIIYRTTAPGHANCEENFRSNPLLAPPNQTELYFIDHPNYHWYDFLGQNKKIMRLLEQKYPHVLIVDIYNSTVLRRDSHPLNHDCLHYCIPGPIDSWIIFIYNALLYATDYLKPSFHENELISDLNSSLIQNDEKQLLGFNEYDIVPVFNYSELGFLPNKPTAVQAKGNNGVFLVFNGERRLIPDGDTLHKMGFSFSHLVFITQEQMYLIPLGPPLQSLA